MKALTCACGRSLWTRGDRERGTCATCYVASWSLEKRQAFQRGIALAVRRAGGESVPDSAFDRAVQDMLKHSDVQSGEEPQG
jgi:hypothetical protein